MSFKKELAFFLYDNQIIKFGNFMLSSGMSSDFYVDIRMLYSYPNQFRKVVHRLLNIINDQIGLENFDCFTAIPTSGLILTSALAFESMKPLIYVRNDNKSHGTSKSIEGHTFHNMKTIIVDDVITTGKTIENNIKALNKNNIIITGIYTIINRSVSDNEFIKSSKISTHEVIHINEVFQYLNTTDPRFNIGKLR